MKLDQARRIANRVKRILEPHCARIEIAGSIRRRKPEPNDIEIVCIPFRLSSLFGDEELPRIHSRGFRDACATLGKRLKGDPSTGKYIQFMLPEGIKLDLFTANSLNWGLIYAIRTGPAYYSHQILARGWCRAGFKSQGGQLVRIMDGRVFAVPEEKDLFRLIGVPYVAPILRGIDEPVKGGNGAADER